MAQKREFFSSRWALVLAALGMAIGTGNIWRFPRIVANNGGGAFLLPWLLFLFLWSIPLIMTEFAIGKKTRVGPMGALGTLVGERYTWMGAFVAFVTIAITFYYSVVAGWCLNYTIAAASGQLAGVQGTAYWESFTGNSMQSLFFHFTAISVSALIIARGVTAGIEKATRLLIPALGVLLIVGAIRAISLPGASDGLQFLFGADWSLLSNHEVWLEALTQSAWSTGAGWGLVMTYAVYMRKDEDVTLNSIVAGLGNNAASLLAALAVIPAVFALAPGLGHMPESIMTDSGPASTGLTFIWIPELFRGLPAANLFLVIFFLALTIAAVSSLIAMVELGVRSFMDLGWTRGKSTLFIWLATLVLGGPSAVNLEFLQNQDWVWGLALLVSGFFVATAANRYGAKRFASEFINTPENDIQVGGIYVFLIRYLIPVQFVILISWWFYQVITAYDPDGWWDPRHTFSIGTCIAQWGIVIAAFLVLNKGIFRRVQENREGAT